MPSNLLLHLTQQRLILPFYHIVSDDNPAHIRHLYAVKRVRAFRKDLDFLLRLYQPIDYFQFQALAAEGKRPAKPVMLLTFDDGLREFHDVIAPILLEKGVPAVCFLNSAFIDNKALFFRYKASLLIAHLEANPRLLAQGDVKHFLASDSKQDGDYQAFIRAVSYQNQAVLDTLAGIIGYDFQAYLSLQQPYLTTPQIRSLLQQGFQFGAHSVDHPEYRTLDFEEQVRQTKESIQTICARFELNYKTFSFPFTDFGVERRFFEQVQQEHIADITFGCAGQKREQFPAHYQRIAFEMGDLSAKEIYNAELQYFAAKAIFGKNILQRK